MPTLPTNSGNVFQLTAARRRLAFALFLSSNGQSFNSQPPEGGWPIANTTGVIGGLFQLTAARRRLGTC